MNTHLPTRQGSFSLHLWPLSAALLAASSLGACQGQAESVSGAATDEGQSGVATFEIRKDLPACNAARLAEVYYVRSENQLYYCDGRDLNPIQESGAAGDHGGSWLVAVSPAGTSACANGGVLLHVGPDRDCNRRLDATEVSSTTAICNGVDGALGPAGATGSTGKRGEPGASGQDGGCSVATDATTSIITISCNDGTRASPNDVNLNGVLDSLENGASGTSGGTAGSDGSAAGTAGAGGAAAGSGGAGGSGPTSGVTCEPLRSGIWQTEFPNCAGPYQQLGEVSVNGVPTSVALRPLDPSNFAPIGDDQILSPPFAFLTSNSASSAYEMVVPGSDPGTRMQLKLVWSNQPATTPSVILALHAPLGSTFTLVFTAPLYPEAFFPARTLASVPSTAQLKSGDAAYFYDHGGETMYVQLRQTQADQFTTLTITRQ